MAKLRHLKKIFALIFLVVSLFSTLNAMATPRTVMVQLFEWPWLDIATECENYLGPNGFSAVQVSPPHEHLSTGQGFWWERYQLVSYQLRSRSGSQAEFTEMVRRCKKAQVDIYVDVILNHTVGVDSGVGFAGTPFVKHINSGYYNYNDFHHCGRNEDDSIKNYKDRYEIQFCDLLGLADLKTESLHVQDVLAAYLNHLMDLGVAGFRIDAAKHIASKDLQNIFSKVNGSPYLISETFIGVDEPVSIYEYMSFSDVNFFQYAFDLGSSIINKNLRRMMSLMNTYPDSKDIVVFVENHDLQRSNSSVILSYQQKPTEYLLAHVFMLSWPYGYPQIFSGFNFADFNQGPPQDTNGFTKSILDSKGKCKSPWNCEHRQPGIAALVQFRNYTNNYFSVTNTWNNGDSQIGFGRGPLGYVVINSADYPLNATIKTGLSGGVYCNILDKDFDPVTDTCSQGLQIKSDGRLQIELPPKTAVVLQSNTYVKTLRK